MISTTRIIYALYTFLLIINQTTAITECVKYDKVSLQLNWVWQAQFAGFQAASTKNYYAQECLSVQIRQGESTFNGLSEVIDGNAHFGNTWTSGVAVEHSNGAQLTVIMQHFQRSGMRLVSKLRPDIQKFTDLENKTVSVFEINRLDASPKAAFAKHGLTNVTTDPQGITPFQLFATDGTAPDAVSCLVYNELAQLYETPNPDNGLLYQPTDLNVFDLNELGAGMLEDNVFVDSNWLAIPENQDITRRFVKATAKGWIYCRDNEDKCRNMLYDHGSHQQWMMREVNRLIWPSPLGVGVMDDAALNNTVDILRITNNLGTNVSVSQLSDSTYMKMAISELEAKGYDVYGTKWAEPELHFCMNAGETTSHICDELEATVCPHGYQPTAAGKCSPCTPGSFAPFNGTGNSCKACPPGTFSTRDVNGVNKSAFMDEVGGILCRGCPSGTRVGADGRVVCGRDGFEDTLLELLQAHKAMVGAWAAAMFVAVFIYIYLRRTYPGADAGVFPGAIATLLETILDGVFLSLLLSQHSIKYFAVAVTGFGCHFLINIFLVGAFLHNEFRASAVRKWAERHHSMMAPVVMLSIANPELLGILCARIGALKITQAPFSRKGLDALRFSTFAAFIAGKAPQLVIEILLLQKEGWHLDPFLAAVTTLTLLTKGTIHYLVYNILQFYKRRRGGMSSKGSQQGGSLENCSNIEEMKREIDVEKVKRDLILAKRKVKELEEVLRGMERGNEGVPMPFPVGSIKATSMEFEGKKRRESHHTDLP